MNEPTSHRCCARFDPAPWQDRVLTWENKRFLRARVTSFLHVPLNFGTVMKRLTAAAEAAGAAVDPPLILSDENSPWGADVYLEVSREVPGARMAALSGTFLSRVFEGPYRNLRAWCGDMQVHVAAQGRSLRKLYVYYTTCPRCARVYGHNYVVLLAQV